MNININDERDPVSIHARLGISLALILIVALFASNILHIPKYKKPFHPVRASSVKEIVHGNRIKKQIIFTFDGGSDSRSAEQILAVLAKHNVKGTFFLTGNFVEKYPIIVRKIYDQGHEIFNHTYDHKHLTELSGIEIQREFMKMEQKMKEVVGNNFSTRPYFRAPYGDRDRRVLHTAFIDGYQSVYWTIDARDWQESEGITRDEVRNIIMNNLAAGNIYLMHLGDTITGSILDDVFSSIEAKGYRIVSLTEGIK